MPNKGFPIKTIGIILILIIAVASLTYWLWQRQPKGLTTKDQTLSPQSQTQSATNSASAAPKIIIDDNKILSQNKFQIQGQTQPNSTVIIYSNSASSIIKSDAQGKFATILNLDSGLNLLGLTVLGSDYKEIAAKNLTYYVAAKTPETVAYAGLVKSIFKDIITLTTQTGDMTVKKTSATNVNVPVLPGVDKQKQDQDVRVGDYMIALGKTVTEGQLELNNIDILRDNKPQNQTHWAQVKILTNFSKNGFSAQQNSQNNTVKITTNTDTAYIDQEKEADSKIVVKDKSALVIYHEDAKSNDIADLVYLLP